MHIYRAREVYDQTNIDVDRHMCEAGGGGEGGVISGNFSFTVWHFLTNSVRVLSFCKSSFMFLKTIHRKNQHIAQAVCPQ